MNQEAPPRLPQEIRIGALVGEGRRSRVFRATYNGALVALKLYREKYVQRYRQRYGNSIARFEHDRNAAFYGVEDLRRYVAKPLLVTGEGDGMSDAFVQEFVDGVALRTLAAETGSVPKETLESVRFIIGAASAAGLHDIDLDPDNLRVRHTRHGWLPVLFDFNMMPQHIRAPNLFVALLYRTGLRDPSYRDRRWLRVLEQL